MDPFLDAIVGSAVYAEQRRRIADSPPPGRS